MPHYKKKITRPMSKAEFLEGMRTGHFAKEDHKGFLAFLYYTGCRSQEALNMRCKDVRVADDRIYIDIKRLKHSRQTAEISFPLSKPYIKNILHNWSDQPEGLLFPFCRTTGFYIVKRVFPDLYPHFFRMSRITNLFLIGKKTPEIKYFIDLDAKNYDPYIGIVESKRIGDEIE